MINNDFVDAVGIDTNYLLTPNLEPFKIKRKNIQKLFGKFIVRVKLFSHDKRTFGLKYMDFNSISAELTQ